MRKIALTTNMSENRGQNHRKTKKRNVPQIISPKKCGDCASSHDWHDTWIEGNAGMVILTAREGSTTHTLTTNIHLPAMIIYPLTRSLELVLGNRSLILCILTALFACTVTLKL